MQEEVEEVGRIHRLFADVGEEQRQDRQCEDD